MSPPGRTLGREPKDGQAHLALSWGCSQCPASPPPPSSWTVSASAPVKG